MQRRKKIVHSRRLGPRVSVNRVEHHEVWDISVHIYLFIIYLFEGKWRHKHVNVHLMAASNNEARFSTFFAFSKHWEKRSRDVKCAAVPSGDVTQSQHPPRMAPGPHLFPQEALITINYQPLTVCVSTRSTHSHPQRQMRRSTHLVR